MTDSSFKYLIIKRIDGGFYVMQFLGVVWSKKRPFILFRNRNDSSNEVKYPLVAGNSFSMDVANRYCIGNWDIDLGRRMPCPLLAPIFSNNGQAQCEWCQEDFVQEPRGLPTFNGPRPGSRSHVVYLSLFGDSIFKVGVSLKTRKDVRNIEQGAYATLYLAYANGHRAHLIEEAVGNYSGFVTGVKRSNKVELLNTRPDTRTAERTLRKLHAGILYGRFPEIVQHPEFKYHIPEYDIRFPSFAKEVMIPQRLSVADTFSGTINTVIGDVVILEDFHGKLFQLPVWSLAGRVVSFSSSEIKENYCQNGFDEIRVKAAEKSNVVLLNQTKVYSQPLR